MKGLSLLYKVLKSTKGAAPLIKYFNPGNPEKFKKAAFSFMQYVKGGAYGGKMSAISTSAKEAPKHAKEILKFRGLKPTQANINKIYQEMFNEGKMLSLEGGRAKLANFNKNMWAKHKYRKRGADAVRKDLTKQRQITKFVEDSERATEPFSRYLNLPNRYKPETYKYYSKVTTGKTPRDFGPTVMDEAKRFGIKPDEPFTLLDMATKGSNRPTPWGLEIGGAWSRYAKTDPGYRSVVDKAWSNFKEMKDEH